ncbi:MAG: MATE family efflux transporter [Evtepia sp.]
MNSNSLAQNWTMRKLIQFTLPTTAMLVFISMYQMVDGIFVSNLIGSDALSAINIVYPLINVILAIAIMFASGGSALIAKDMGEGERERAKENFTMLILVGFLLSLLFSVMGLFFTEPIIRMLGATDLIVQYCIDYLKPLLIFAPFMMLQLLFQNLFATAGKPHLGLLTTLFSGCVNIILDYIFIARLHIGIGGAALATLIGYCCATVFGILYFALNRSGTLYFVKPKFSLSTLLKVCGNGSSEMVSNISVAVITFVLNFYMLKFYGEDGVAAITVILYASFLLTSAYLGFSGGTAPVFSYYYGANDPDMLKKLFRYSMILVVASSIVTFLIALVLADPIISVFARRGTRVFEIAHKGFPLFAISFLLTGVNIFASALFTAFSNGKISALISFLRTFLFIMLFLAVLPPLIGVTGIWIAVPLAEFATLFISLICFKRGWPRQLLIDN